VGGDGKIHRQTLGRAPRILKKQKRKKCRGHTVQYHKNKTKEQPLESNNQGYELTETEPGNLYHQSDLGPLYICYSDALVVLPTVKKVLSLILLPAFRTLLLLLGCLVQA
jgi:hypothetical protein